MRRLLAAAAAVAALAATAAASIVLRVTPRDLADTAQVVAEGRVAAVDVRWDAGRTCINTYVTLTVDRVLKGAPAGSLVVKVPGGKVGDEEVRVEGTAKFERDEQVVVFLWKDGAGEWIVLGEAQGKFRLWQDEKAGKRMAANSLKGLCLVVRDSGKEAAAAARRADTLSYDDLAAVVKASVDAAKAPAPPKGPGPAAGPAAGPAPAPGTTTDAPAGTTGTPAGTTPEPTGGSAQPPAGTTAEPKTDPAAGRDPAPPKATPDPPSTTTTKPPGDGAPPPSKDAPAPRAGASDTPGTGQTPPPAPEKK